MSELKKSKTITKKAELRFTSDEITDAVIGAVMRDHRELRGYGFECVFQNDGSCLVLATHTTGAEDGA